MGNSSDEGYRKAIADEALRSADTPNPLGLNEDSAQYSGQSIQSAEVERVAFLGVLD